MSRRVVAPDGTEWRVSRRREPEGEAEEAARAEGRRFADSPLGWLLFGVVAAALVALTFVFPLAALAAATLLLAVEVADRVRRGGKRAWLVEASPAGSEDDRAWRVPGRRRSASAAAEVARALERGQADVELPGAERLR